jgi:hypothetical protein
LLLKKDYQGELEIKGLPSALSSYIREEHFREESPILPLGPGAALVCFTH